MQESDRVCAKKTPEARIGIEELQEAGNSEEVCDLGM